MASSSRSGSRRSWPAAQPRVAAELPGAFVPGSAAELVHHQAAGLMKWVIRPAVRAEAAELSALAERTFRDSFAGLNTPENMDLHCSTAFAPALQAAEIADPDIRTVVADSGGRLVAFAQLHLREEPPACVSVSPAVELRRIYVERFLHGSGLAGELLSHVLELARKSGAAAVWLGVWERNPRAIRFYQRFDFSEVGEHVFTVGTDPQRDLVMVRDLNAYDPPAQLSP